MKNATSVKDKVYTVLTYLLVVILILVCWGVGLLAMGDWSKVMILLHLKFLATTLPILH